MTSSAPTRVWHVSISDLERHQLRLLRTELRIDPPPANTDDRKTNRTNDIAV